MRDEVKSFLAPGYARLAVFDGLDAAGAVSVTVEGMQRTALSLVPLTNISKGAEVAVVYLDGDPERPLILGAIIPPQVSQVDGKIELVGEREVVLRCGSASIRLTPDGRVTIRGTRILSRAEGSNRVQGASVELN